MPNPPFTVYRDQLTSLYHGIALWKPNPPKDIYDKVSIGDVGYVHEGGFIRMFNVMLPWDDKSNGILGEPMHYESLSCGRFANIIADPLDKGEYCSLYVSTESNAGNNQAMAPDDMEGVTYRCRNRGALLSLPHGAHRKDIVRKKAFEDYVRDHVVSWFNWTQDNKLGVKHIEELILVSGCTLATSWAVAAFVDNAMEAEVSLASRTLGDSGEASFIWSNMQGPVRYSNSRFDPQNPPTTPDQCVFIRGFRAKRVLFWTRPMQAAAEPPPDDPENRSDDEIQVTEVPGVPEYRDPLIGLLDYIVEKCLEDTISEDTIAIAHDDDLQLIKGVETLTADAVEDFLRETKMPLRVENGAAILWRKWVERLPHMADLSGKVTRTCDHPIVSGGSQDIYTGEWAGQNVALAYPRNQSRAGRERFQREVAIWRTLQHPNILPLLGIASIGDFVYSVSPYMEFGHVTRILKAYPDADRVLLLSEIASATEYLHTNGIILGDLQGSNVLISRDGHAYLGDLGSARAEEVPVREAIPYGSLRWLAPELLADSNYISTTRATDVWSFGMLSLEIFTGNVPFSHVSNEGFIPLVIRDGPLPTRPEHTNTRGLSDAMWNLMNQCWDRDPESRPSMPEIRGAIQNIRSFSRSGKPSMSIILPEILSTGLTPLPKPPVPIPLSCSPERSIPCPRNISPLSSSCRTPLTSPEPRPSVNLSNDHSSWPLKQPVLLPDLSSSSNTGSPQLLQPTPSWRSISKGGYRRADSTSTASIQSIAKRTSTSSSDELLEAAVQDTDPLLRRTADGTVEAGTLVGLIDRLIKVTHDRAKDDEFRRVFLATYPLFTTDEDLFRNIKRHFEEMGDVQSFTPSGSSRYSTLLVLRTWLEGEGEHWSRELLSSIREFARSIGGSDTMNAEVQDIANLADERMNIVVVSRTPSLHGTLPSLSLEQFKPKDIADSLTVIEGEFYSKITEADYIAHVRGTPITTHIASARNIHKSLVNWVRLHVMSFEGVKMRSTKFKHFVLLAEECRKSQNFSSMSAIVTALQSLSQLILTCDITKNEKRLLAQLVDILAPESDHRAYRKALQETKSSITIPWLDVHLRSLQDFYESGSSTVIIDQRPLIYFIYCAKLLQRIDDIRRYQPPSADPQVGKTKDKFKSKIKSKDKDKRAPVSLAWVKKELDNTPVISMEQSEARVSKLAEAEHQSHKRHEIALGLLGFTAPSTRAPHPSSAGSLSPRLSPGGRRTPSPDSDPEKT